MQRSVLCLTAFAAGLLGLGGVAASAAPGHGWAGDDLRRPPEHAHAHRYRPLPPVSGTLHMGPRVVYAGPSAPGGPAVYQLHGRQGWRYGAPSRSRYGSVSRYRDLPLTVRYGEPPLLPPDGVYAAQAAYGGQSYGYGGYGGQTDAGQGYGGGLRVYSPAPAQAYPYGPAGGLGVYSAGSFGPGPRVITIPPGYGYAASSSTGCSCGRPVSDHYGWNGGDDTTD